MIYLTINTSGAAFDDAAPEVARILRGLADKVAGGDVTPGDLKPVLDVNGNTVGDFVWGEV